MRSLALTPKCSEIVLKSLLALIKGNKPVQKISAILLKSFCDLLVEKTSENKSHFSDFSSRLLEIGVENISYYSGQILEDKFFKLNEKANFEIMKSKINPFGKR